MISEKIFLDGRLLIGRIIGRDLEILHQRSVLWAFSRPAPGHSGVICDECNTHIHPRCIEFVEVSIKMREHRRRSDMGGRLIQSRVTAWLYVTSDIRKRTHAHNMQQEGVAGDAMA